MNIQNPPSEGKAISQNEINMLWQTHGQQKCEAAFFDATGRLWTNGSITAATAEEQRRWRDNLEPPLPLPDPDDDLLTVADDAPATAPQEPVRSALHQAALDYAAKGWPIFPCISNEVGKPLPPKDRKKPACAHGFKDATTDAATINAWWAENPDYNIAIEPERIGCGVIEDDPGADVAPLNLPETRSARSPRGGTHRWFKGSLPPTASTKLGPKIDTRGARSYVLLPPSVVNDKPYVWLNDLEPAPLPDLIAKLFAAKEEARGSDVHETDVPGNYERGRERLRALVAEGKIAIEGNGGDNLTYKVCCELIRDLGLSVERAEELMLAEFNPHCVPPWEPEELRTKLEHAASYGQNEAGAYASEPASKVFEQVATKSDKPPQPSTKFLLTLRDIYNFPDPEPLIEGLLMERENTCWYGPKKGGKSFAALDAALSIATGRPVYGTLEVPHPGPVIYLTSEGKNGFKKRILAWMQHNGFGKDVDKFLDTVPFYFKPSVPVAARGFDEAKLYIDGITQHLSGKPRLVIIDTLSKAMRGLNENDPGDGELYMAMAEELIDQLDCTTLTLAHSGKDESKEIRGTSAFGGGFDAIWRIEPNKEAKTLKLQSEDMKDSGDLGPYYLHLRSVHVANMKNGSTAVVEPITKEQFDGRSSPQADSSRALRRAVADVLLNLKAFSVSKGRTLDNMADIFAGPEPTGNDVDQRIKWQTCRATWKAKLLKGTKEHSNGKSRPPTPPQLKGMFEPADFFNNGELVPVFWMPEPDTANDDLGPNSFGAEET